MGGEVEGVEPSRDRGKHSLYGRQGLKRFWHGILLPSAFSESKDDGRRIGQMFYFSQWEGGKGWPGERNSETLASTYLRKGAP